MKEKIIYALGSTQNSSPVTRHLARAAQAAALAFCLAVAGCGLISVGVSNSPDWCPNPRSTAPCP